MNDFDRAKLMFENGIDSFKNEAFKNSKEYFEKSLKLIPNRLSTLNNYAATLIKLENYEEAKDVCEKVIKIDSKSPEAYLNYGEIYFKEKNYDIAIFNFTKAIEYNINYVEAYYNLGNLQLEIGAYELSIDYYEKALSVNNNFAQALVNKGIALYELGSIEEAIRNYDKAILINSNLAEAHLNRGNALERMQLLEDAIQSYDIAININNKFAQAYHNKGVALGRMGRLDEAISNYDKAISIDSNYAESYLSKAYALLLAGKFTEGWKLHEWRWRSDQFINSNRKFDKKLWKGEESLSGKTILLYGEQGLGDSIQFCRYAKMVQELGAKVVLEIPKSLVILIGGLEGVDTIVEQGNVLPNFDFQCPLMSLPLAFNTQIYNIPFSSAYIKVDSSRIELWRHRLGIKTKTRVGIVWSGNSEHKNDRNRSIKLEDLLSYLTEEQEFICLQKEVRTIDIDAIERSAIKCFTNEITDFMDTAALCSLMDVVISVDTSVAHLSSAIGQKTWLMLPYSPDWRWLLDREDSPWYKSMKIYRQGPDCKWESLFDMIKSDLDSL